jgi:AcrR family transcriptional regulator
MPRPKSREAHDKVLRAALELIAENGIDGTSMDAIVRASGVSKATLYKHWPNKEALCLEATIPPQPDRWSVPSSQDPRTNIVDFLTHLATRQRPENLGRIWPRVVTYAAGNPKFARAWHARATAPYHELLSEWIGQATKSGELRSDLDIDLAIDLLVGPVMHRRFMNATVPGDVPREVVEAFWRAFAPDSSRRGARRGKREKE